MRALVPVMFAALAFAGCGSSSSEGCPDGLPAGYEESYLETKEQFEAQGMTIPDADGDCVPDPVEQELGSDPNDAASIPDFSDPAVQQELINSTRPMPPPPTYAWEEETFTGTYQANAALDLESRIFKVPDGAIEAYFNVTLTGSVPIEKSVEFKAPSCDANDCRVGGTSSGNVYNHHQDEPESGDWELVLFSIPADTGDYTVVVNSRVIVGGLQVNTTA